MDMILLGIYYTIALIIPGIITIWNLLNLFLKKKRKPVFILWLTTFLGFINYISLFGILWTVAGDYDQVVNQVQCHNPIATKYVLSFIIPILLGYLGLLVIGSVKAESLSPLVSAACSVFIIMGNVMGVFFAIQIYQNDKLPELLLLYLYQFNMLILSVDHIYKALKEQIALLNKRNTVMRFRWMQWLYPKICSISRMRILVFLCIFPIAIILLIVLILFGQGPDGFVKAFTMTADWNFSTQIPPPPVYYNGHYLCTVAAGGHRKVVRPLRLGTRLGATIIVNRQLCIANAFEELIQQRTPAFHKRIRGFYDKHGYPLSRLITTPVRADIVYVVMKPLEWLFLFILYLFDQNPENRIAHQYEWKG